MGVQLQRVRFKNIIPSNDLILIKIYEKTSRRVKLSINILLTPEEAEHLALRAGFSDFLKKEIVSYKLEHPKFQAITFRYREEKGKKYTEFETGINFFKKI